MTRIVLQKLLHPALATMILERGYDQVGGYVVEAASAATLSTPASLRAAYGLADGDDPWVDVVRYYLPACARLTPPAGLERPWPAYPNGFLRPVGDAVIPVWVQSTTRYSLGAEVWRIHEDGRQEMVSFYGGAAVGWSGSREWRPASRYYGTRALWNGVEYAADIDVDLDMVEITSFAQPDGEGWTQRRPATWSRRVPLAECEVYELDFQASLDGVPVRILEVIDANVRLQLIGDDPAVAERLSAGMVDFGVFEMSGVSGALLADTRLIANQLVTQA